MNNRWSIRLTVALATAALSYGALAADMASPPNSLVVDDTGNVGVGTATPAASLDVVRSDNSARLVVTDTGGGANQMLLHLKKTTNAPFQRYTSQFGTWDFSAGNFFVINDPADATIEMLVEKDGDMTISGILTQNSSRDVKHGIEPVDPRDVLARLSKLQVSHWTYIEDDAQARQMGPMAEDFASAFGLGATDKGIASLDATGVALAAIQGLVHELEAKNAELAALKSKTDAQIEALTDRLNRLEQQYAVRAGEGQLAAH